MDLRRKHGYSHWVISCLLFTGLFHEKATAQSPAAVYAMAYTTLGDTFYIQGGTADIGKTGLNQLFQLELTGAQWNSDSPPWKALPSNNGGLSAPSSWEHSMAPSIDNKTLIVYDSTPQAPGISIFNIADGTWTKNAFPSTPVKSNLYGLRSATDPKSGLLYIPTGTLDNQTMVYDPYKNTGTSIPNPDATIMNPVVVFYSAVWSTVRNSVIMYGGRGITPTGNVPNPYLAELVPSQAAVWKKIEATGDLPGAVERHCMVPAYGGSMMVLFGGSTVTRQSLGSIYFLDVKSLVWKKGVDVDPPHNRSGMACTVVGDNFIAWGGEHYETSVITLNTTLIYNLKANQWVNQYSLIPPAPTSGGSTTTGSNNGSKPSNSATGNNDNKSGSSSGGSNGAIIGGSVVGVLVVIVIAVFLVHRRRRSNRDNMKNIAPPSYSTLAPLNLPQDQDRSNNKDDTPNVVTPVLQSTQIDTQESLTQPQAFHAMYPPKKSESFADNEIQRARNPQAPQIPQRPLERGVKVAVHNMPDLSQPSPLIYPRGPQEHQEIYPQSNGAENSRPVVGSPQYPPVTQSISGSRSPHQSTTSGYNSQQKVAIIKAQQEEALEKLRLDQEAELQIEMIKLQREEKLERLRLEQEERIQSIQNQQKYQQ